MGAVEFGVWLRSLRSQQLRLLQKASCHWLEKYASLTQVLVYLLSPQPWLSVWALGP